MPSFWPIAIDSTWADANILAEPQGFAPPELEFSSDNVSSQPVLKTIRRSEYAELIALFFL
jgi:hypothetical protein